MMELPFACVRIGMRVTALLLTLATPRAAHAQAWVPDLGDGTISLSTQYSRVLKHLLGTGDRAYFGDLTTMTTTLAGEYVPLRRLALTAEAHYLESQYEGDLPGSAHDDGSFHGGLQDATLGARYMLPVRPFALTPSIDVRFPLRDYDRHGHTAPGAHLRSLALGIHAGRSLDPLAPMAYVFASYSRVIVEDADGYSLDRSHFIGGCGLFFSRALSAQAHYEYTEADDGVDWERTEPDQVHRTVAARALVRRVGLSAGYSLTHRIGLAASWESTISGANAHAAHSATLGMSWGFWKKRTL
jgi:hypothetical protein